ncbi:MAG: CoA-binding protein [Syntrophorhabdales bacterium]|jgi:predicted CoA-binding protein
MGQDKAIEELLRTSRVIAMVGLSADEGKPSNAVARYLLGKGYRVIPVNPGQETILGEKSYGSLADIEEKIDIVDIFMKAERVLPVVREAIRLHPSAIWLQLGIVNEEAKALADASNIMFVMDRCVKQEHARLVSDAS